ncbi:MAG: phosphoglycerate mutase family protein [Oceanospirillaceae bacterium]
MLHLMRHGEASWNAKTDMERSLTEQGIRSIKQLSLINLEHFRHVQKIVCSPYLRTHQTAQLMAENMAGIEVIFDDSLTPESTVKNALLAIEKYWCDELLVVTHQPLIGNLISYLEHGVGAFPEPVDPGTVYSLSMVWPGLGCAQRESVFFV